MTTLVVTDLDGTVWDTDLRAHPTTRAAIDALVADPNVELLAATGRRRNSARRAFRANGFVLPSVLLNGAVGYDFANEAIFHQVGFEPADLAAVLKVLTDGGLGPVAYRADTKAIVVEGVTTSVAHLDSLGDDLLWSSVADLAAQPDVLGMSMLGIEPELAHSVLDELDAMPGAEVAAYADHLYPPYSLMIAPANVTKSVGIKAWCDHKGLQPDRIIALGDGGNDLAMLDMADVALVVHDGDARAVALADALIDSPEAGGWASVLDHL